MGITSDLSDLFSDSVVVEVHIADDGFGNEGFVSGGGTAYDCHISAGGEKRSIPGDAQLQEYITKGKVTFAGTFGVKRGDRLTLPDDFDPNIVIVEEAAKPRDEDGAHHDKVFF